MKLTFNIIILLFVLVTVTETNKTPRQLNQFTSKCHGNTCDYVVQISQNGEANGTVSLPRQILQEMSQFRRLLRDLSSAVQSSMANAHAQRTGLQSDVAAVQAKFELLESSVNNTFLDVETMIDRKLAAMKTEVYRLEAMVNGRTPDGFPIVVKTVSPDLQIPQGFGVDCASLYRSGVNRSDIYTLQPDPADNSTRFDAYCDMDTAGGGWTLIQGDPLCPSHGIWIRAGSHRRIDGSDDFFRNWQNYKEGFGNLYHDFWLGLDKIHLLSKFGNNKMRFDLWDWERNTNYSEFSFVRISDEADKYRIMAGAYTGRAGDPFHTFNYDLRMQSMRFSTFDNDIDRDAAGNCARTFASGWWFSNCFVVNPNGVWYPSSSYYGRVSNGVVWDLWSQHPRGYSLKQTEIKLRPDNF